MKTLYFTVDYAVAGSPGIYCCYYSDHTAKLTNVQKQTAEYAWKIEDELLYIKQTAGFGGTDREWRLDDHFSQDAFLNYMNSLVLTE